jgi:hypothetical protein
MDEGSSHGAIFPLAKTTPQWSRQVRSSLTKGGKRGKRERWVCGEWSFQKIFKGNLSMVEKGTLFNGEAMKAKG